MSDNASFELTSEERTYFQRLFRRELLSIGAGVVVVLFLFWVLGIQPLRSREPTTGDEFTEHGGIALDLRTEVERLVAEIVPKSPAPAADGPSSKPDPRIDQALEEITQLLAKLEKSRARAGRIEKRLGELEKTKSAPAAASGTAVGDIDLDKLRERIFNTELRQDREEKKREDFFQDVLARIEKLEVRQGAAEGTAASDTTSMLKRVEAIEARLSASEN